MDVVTCDIETFYSREFSLKKMSTERYIRDPRFEIIGVAVKVNGEQSDWYSGENFGRFLHGMKYHDKAILGHNVAFDGAILSWLFNINPKLWLDTMSMARPFHAMTEGVSLAKLVEHYGLGAKGTDVLDALGKRRQDFTAQELDNYATYCKNDADLTWALFNKLKGKLPKQEFISIDQTIRMFTQPVFELDVPLLEAHLADVRAKKEKLLDAVLTATAATYEVGQDKTAAVKSLMSAELLAGMLRKFGVEPPTKMSAKTGKLSYAFAKTDQEFLDLLEHENPIVQTLVGARLGIKSTLEETRTEAFIGIAERGSLPIMLGYFGAHTGRYSGGDKVNLQNLPRGGALRKSLKAPKDKVVITSDLSQIEARMLAYVAGQDDLVEAFDQGRDPYCEFGSALYDRVVTKADKLERFASKVSVLSLGFGTGWEKLQKTLAIGQGGMKLAVDDTEAKRIVQFYRRKNHKIVAFWERCKYVLSDMARGGKGRIVDTIDLTYDGDKIILPNGMPINYPGLEFRDGGYVYYKHKKAVKIYGAKMAENIIQALARIVIAGNMIEARKRYNTVLQVHDEIVFVAPKTEELEAKDFIGSLMRKRPFWAPGLPVECEVGSGPNYGEAK